MRVIMYFSTGCTHRMGAMYNSLTLTCKVLYISDSSLRNGVGGSYGRACE